MTPARGFSVLHSSRAKMARKYLITTSVACLIGFSLLAGCRQGDNPAATITTVDAANGVRFASLPAVMVGGFGVGAGQFQSVGPVAVSENGHLYVADNTQRRVTIISAETGPLPPRSFFPGLANPLVPGDTVQAIRAMRWQGSTLYLLDRARIWAVTGASARSIQPEGGLADIRDMVVGADGSFYLLSERGVRVCSPAGALRDSIVVRGEAPPRCAALSFGPDSALYISSRALKQVLVYGRDGRLVKRIGEGTFNGGASALAVDQFGNVFARDEKEFGVRAFSADGVSRALIGSRGSGPGQMLSMDQLVLDHSRHALIAPDPTNYRVQVFDLTGRRADARDLVTHTPTFERNRRPYHITLGMGQDASTQMQIVWKTTPNATGSMAVYVPLDGASLSDVDWSGPAVKTVSGQNTTYAGNIGTYRTHTVALRELMPGARYAYRVGDGSSEGWSEIHTFSTPPVDPDSLNIAIVGDSQTRVHLWRQAVQGAASHNPAFFARTGDNVNDGENLVQWDAWFAEASEILATTPFMVVAGNHERESPNFYNSFEMPRNGPVNLQEQCFSFDVGPTHWIGLNSITGVREQTAWLENDLKTNTRPWVFVFFHRPVYAAHPSRGDGNRDVREEWGPLFDRYGVDALFHGHDHYYHRSKPVRAGEVVQPGQGPVYVVTGGGGSGLYPLAPNRYTEAAESVEHYTIMTVRDSSCIITAYRLDGSVLDRFSLAERPPDAAR